MKNILIGFLFLAALSAKAQTNKMYQLGTPVQGFDTTFTHIKYKVTIGESVEVFWFLPADTSLDLFDVGGRIVIPDSVISSWDINMPNWASDGETIGAYLEEKRVWKKK